MGVCCLLFMLPGVTISAAFIQQCRNVAGSVYRQLLIHVNCRCQFCGLLNTEPVTHTTETSFQQLVFCLNIYFTKKACIFSECSLWGLDLPPSVWAYHQAGALSEWVDRCTARCPSSVLLIWSWSVLFQSWCFARNLLHSGQLQLLKEQPPWAQKPEGYW